MDKRDYSVAAHVNRINGQIVSRTRRVSLSDSEALYERALGRVQPVGMPKRNRGRKAPTK